MKISFSSGRFRDPEYAVRPVGTVASAVPLVVSGNRPLRASVQPVGTVARPYHWSLKLPVFSRILTAICSYELRLRRSLARWIRIDEGYNTMVLDLCILLWKNRMFPPSNGYVLVPVAPQYCILLSHFFVLSP